MESSFHVVIGYIYCIFHSHTYCSAIRRILLGRIFQTVLELGQCSLSDTISYSSRMKYNHCAQQPLLDMMGKHRALIEGEGVGGG